MSSGTRTCTVTSSFGDSRHLWVRTSDRCRYRSAEDFAGIVKDLVAAKPERLFGFEANWFVWRVPTGNGERLVLFQGERIWSIPGTSNARVYLFDMAGRLAGQSSFSTGWRIDIVDAEIVTDKIEGETLIRVSTAPVINGADIAKQYYAIVDDAPVLLRLEDSSGACLANVYSAPNHTIGPEAVARTETEWVRALADPRATEVLRTLAWIGGHHYNPPLENPFGIHIEDFNQATLHLKVRDNPQTKSSVLALTVNANVWISEAARLALATIEEPR